MKQFPSPVLAGFVVIALLMSGCAQDSRQHQPIVADGEPSQGQSPCPPQRAMSTLAERLVWPIERGTISSGFGNQRSDHRHRGIDIRVPPGTSIRAAAAGRITFSGRMRGYGNVIFLDHGDGLETRYAHNRRNRVRKNDWVKAGAVIAEVGSTGNASAPHLHFEVREDGRAEDPLSFLPPSELSVRR